MSLFRKFMGQANSAASESRFDTPLQPEEPFFVIGDIHGCMSALQQCILEIEGLGSTPTVVCVGDYIDRGEKSAEVLRWVHHLNTTFPDRFMCLKGNHEHMCLRFLADPEAQGERWLRYGGLQTLASFGIGRSHQDIMTDIRNRLFEAMGEALVMWMADLPVVWNSGNVYVVHAGADPNTPLEMQTPHTLMWGHSDFLSRPRQDGNWIVHGHTIVDQATAHEGRISVDTGAYATGQLSAAHISENGVQFLTS